MKGDAQAGAPGARGRGQPARRFRLALAAAMAGCLALGLLLPSPFDLETGPGFAAVPERPFQHTVVIALYWAAWVDLALLGLLLATSGLWARPLSAPLPVRAVPRLARGLVLLTLLAVAVGGVLRWPVAHKSFWWDEGWSISRVVRGFENPSAADPRVLELEGRHWARTLWYWKKPTNHVLYNVTGRASLEAWQRVSGRGPEALSEFAFRLPAYLAALLTIAGLGVLGWRTGYPAAGATAALLMALHPWAARYSVDARAYAFLIPLSLLAVLALTEALRRGRWPAWLAFAGAQLGLLWTHPFMLYLSVALSIAALVGIRAAPVPSRDRLTLLLRFVAANALAAVAFLLVMAPNLAQVFIWDDEANGRPLNLRIATALWSRIATGVPWKAVPEGSPQLPAPALESLAEAVPGVGLVVFGLLPLVAAFGLVRVLRGRGPVAGPLLAVVATVPLSMAVVHATGQLYYHRFYAFATWAFLFCLVVGLEGVARLVLPRHPRARAAAVAAACLGWLALAAPQIAVVWSRPIAPLRDVAGLTRSLAGEDPLSTIRVGYGLGGGMPRLYDPWIRPVATREELQQQIDAAEREGLPLYVLYGQPAFNRRRRPEGFELLDDPGRFAVVATFAAIEPRFTYHVLCYRRTGTGCPAPVGPEGP